MRKFEINERVVEISSGKKATVFWCQPGSCAMNVIFDESPKFCSPGMCDSFAHESTDGTVLPQHRAKSSGALKGWR